MSVTRALSVGLCLCVLSVGMANAATKTPEAKAKPPPATPGHATVYFLRPEGMLGALQKLAGSPSVKVDNADAGELPVGTYLVVNRPAGHHVLEINGGFLASAWTSEVDLAAGKAYFFALVPRSNGAPGSELLQMALAGAVGTRLPGHGIMAAYSFVSLDAEHARAEIAKMQKVGR